MFTMLKMVMGAGFHKEPKKKQKKGDDEDEMEDAAGREARWGRVALAATKQSLRCVAIAQEAACHQDTYAAKQWNTTAMKFPSETRSGIDVCRSARM